MITDKLTEGRSVWWVPIYHPSRGSTVTVVKVGRVWATLSNGHRANVKNGVVDGGGDTAPAELFDSEESWRAEVEVKRAFRILRNCLPYTPPPGVTVDDIAAAAKLLGAYRE